MRLVALCDSPLNSALLLVESGNNSKLLGILQSAATELSIPIYIIGGMAVANYGYQRFTNDIDILIYTNDSSNLANWLFKRGFVDQGRNHLVNGPMVINICTPDVVAGTTKFPPIPSNTPGVKVIDLPRLLAMKLDANRYKDRADFVELVKANKISLDYITNQVAPLVQNQMAKRMATTLWKKAQAEMK